MVLIVHNQKCTTNWKYHGMKLFIKSGKRPCRMMKGRKMILYFNMMNNRLNSCGILLLNKKILN